MRTLRLTRPHMRGRDVAYLWRRLRELGVWAGPPEEMDEVFETVAVRCVKLFQAASGLPVTGDVDEVTWLALANQKHADSFYSPATRLLASEALSLLQVPYCYGSSDPNIGLDAVGFLMCVNSRTFGIPIQDVSLTTIFEKSIKSIDPKDQTPVRGNWVFYGNDPQGPVTHCMLVLNNLQVIGPVGGNRATTNRLMALRRDAMVKIKPLHYRDHIVGSRDVFNVRDFLRG